MLAVANLLHDEASYGHDNRNDDAKLHQRSKSAQHSDEQPYGYETANDDAKNDLPTGRSGFEVCFICHATNTKCAEFIVSCGKRSKP